MAHAIAKPVEEATLVTGLELDCISISCLASVQRNGFIVTFPYILHFVLVPPSTALLHDPSPCLASSLTTPHKVPWNLVKSQASERP